MKDHINQKRVLKIPSALTTSGASRARLVVPIPDDSAILEAYHLSRLERPGDRIIPTPRGPATKRNILGRTLIHRDCFKELRHWTVYWGREQFCGRGETEWVEDYVVRSCFRFPRTQLPPENIELSLASDANGGRYFATDFIEADLKERWIVATNLMLEIFGHCWITDEIEFEALIAITRRVGWRFLPRGKRPWEKLQPELDEVVKSMVNPVHRRRAERSLEIINRHGPEQVVVGEGGFRGYVAFCFEDRGFTVLESIQPNNATYIFGANWESLSRLTKGEILEGELHLDRIIHSSRWIGEMGRWFPRQAA